MGHAADERSKKDDNLWSPALRGHMASSASAPPARPLASEAAFLSHFLPAPGNHPAPAPPWGSAGGAWGPAGGATTPRGASLAPGRHRPTQQPATGSGGGDWPPPAFNLALGRSVGAPQSSTPAAHGPGGVHGHSGVHAAPGSAYAPGFHPGVQPVWIGHATQGQGAPAAGLAAAASAHLPAPAGVGGLIPNPTQAAPPAVPVQDWGGEWVRTAVTGEATHAGGPASATPARLTPRLSARGAHNYEGSGARPSHCVSGALPEDSHAHGLHALGGYGVAADGPAPHAAAQTSAGAAEATQRWDSVTPALAPVATQRTPKRRRSRSPDSQRAVSSGVPLGGYDIRFADPVRDGRHGAATEAESRSGAEEFADGGGAWLGEHGVQGGREAEARYERRRAADAGGAAQQDGLRTAARVPALQLPHQGAPLCGGPPQARPVGRVGDHRDEAAGCARSMRTSCMKGLCEYSFPHLTTPCTHHTCSATTFTLL